MRVFLGSVLVAGAALLLSPVAAHADDPVDLQGAYVLDTAGVVADEGAVQDAIDALYDERGTQLFVVYVDRFEGAVSDQQWANETAELSGLGDSDVLFAIATEDRVARWSVTDSFPLSDRQLQGIFDDRVVPELRDDDWAGGAIAFAQGLSDAQAPSLALPIGAGVVLGGVAVTGAVVALRRRGSRKRVEAAAKADRDELDRRAGSLLVELDDALKTSEQELGFAQAQFGEAQTRDFEAALSQAKATAKQAFEIRQKLDDAFPETPDEHRALTLQLIELAEQADATLDAQADAFDALRELEKNAPQVLEQVAAEHEGLPARIEAAETRITELGATYPSADLTTVRGVPAQARKLTAFAATAIADARERLGARGEAAVAVRGAQQAVGQVGQLLASVDTLGANLAAEAEAARTAAAELDSALQTARSSVSSTQDYITTNRGAVRSTARTRISEAERHLAAATAAGVETAVALTEARDAERLAGQALAAARADVDDYERQSEVRDYGRSDPADLERSRYEEADGASLGGILADLFFGGGGSSSSGSSWSWGGSSGGGWSSSRPSSFGGSSRRSSSSSSRRSSSSSRSSGGRRGGGGRF